MAFYLEQIFLLGLVCIIFFSFLVLTRATEGFLGVHLDVLHIA